MTSSQNIAAISYLGSGLGYRRELKKAIYESEIPIDFLEIVTEQFVESPDLEELEDIRRRFTVIPHGIGLSIGSMTPLDKRYLRAIKRISDCSGSPYYSEHLCMTRVPGIDIGHLAPLLFTESVLSKVIDSIAQIQDLLGKPLVLENVTYLFEIPGSHLDQAEFFRRAVEATGCGILLDVTNLYINSVNHHFDPFAFLAQMPLDAIVQVHLAGGFWHEQVLIDGHSEPIQDGTWTLLEKLATLVSIRGSIIEHDSNFPDDASALLRQVERARGIIRSPQYSGASKS